jgi:hypothetical protein
MKVFTTHLREDAAPVLVREGFSVASLVFGWLWLLWHMAWIPAALNLALAIAAAKLAQVTGSLAPLFGLLALQGLFGLDLVRWGLQRRGFVAGPVLAAADEDSALARLFKLRSDLPVTLAGLK